MASSQKNASLAAPATAPALKPSRWLWVMHDLASTNAGLRIRVQPILKQLKEQGLPVEIRSVQNLADDFGKRRTQNIIGIVISKPKGSTAALLVHQAKRLGIPVVVDLFDNYFLHSRWADALDLHWQTMQAVVQSDAVICSSPNLSTYIRDLFPEKTVVDQFDALPWAHDSLDQKVLEKQARKWDGDKVDLLWFGIPSNPYYRAGLVDLIDVKDPIIRAIPEAARGRTTLTICTRHSHNAERAVAQFRRAGLRTRFVDWTEEACNALLSESHGVLLPTNVGAFAKAKTHNRLSDAIHRGCLVYTTSGGPYDGLEGGAVFSSPAAMLSVLFAAGRASLAPALLTETIDRLEDAVRVATTTGVLSQSLGQLSTKQTLQPQSTLDVNRAVAVMGFEPATSTVELSRKMSYFIANFSGSRNQMACDFLLGSINVEQRHATLRVSDAALAWLNQFAPAKFTEMTTPNTIGCFISENVGTESLSDLVLLHRLAGAHPTLTRQFAAASIAVLVDCLKHLGLDQTFFVEDGHGTWRSYCDMNEASFLQAANRSRENQVVPHG